MEQENTNPNSTIITRRKRRRNGSPLADITKEKSEFRIYATYFFLTYPRCNLEIEYVAQKLETMFPDKIHGTIICMEKHSDDTPHLHCLIKFKNRKNIRDAHAFDIDGFHCNIQAVRDIFACIAYTKKDNNYIEFGYFKKEESKELTKKQALEKVVRGEIEIKEAVERCPMLILEIEKLKKAMEIYTEMINRPNRIPTAKEWETLQKIEWLYTDSLFEFRFFNTPLETRRITQTRGKALYIWGPPQVGKTTWVREYFENVWQHIYVATNENNWPHFDEEIHRIILIEDYDGKWFLPFLIKIIDGFCQLNVKYSYAYITKHIGVIFVSNIDPTQITCDNEYVKEAFLSRLISVEMQMFMKIKNIKDHKL